MESYVAGNLPRVGCNALVHASVKLRRFIRMLSAALRCWAHLALPLGHLLLCSGCYAGMKEVGTFKQHLSQLRAPVSAVIRELLRHRAGPRNVHEWKAKAFSFE